MVELDSAIAAMLHPHTIKLAGVARPLSYDLGTRLVVYSSVTPAFFRSGATHSILVFSVVSNMCSNHKICFVFQHKNSVVISSYNHVACVTLSPLSTIQNMITVITKYLWMNPHQKIQYHQTSLSEKNTLISDIPQALTGDAHS